MNENKITNLNEYKSENLQNEVMIEEMSPEMLDAYYRMSEENTPDLWERIEKGVDVELSSIRLEAQNERLRKRKVRNMVAAVVIVTIIAVPVVAVVSGLGGSKEKSSDIKYDHVYDGADMQENVKDEYYAEDTEVVTEAVAEDCYDAESGENLTPTESMINSQETSDQEETEEEIKDARVLSVEGELVDFDYDNYTVSFRVDKILSNEYEEFKLKKGTVIIISNPMKIYIIDNAFVFWEIEFDSLTTNEEGKYEARIKDMKVPE
ncbi:MAG: hypothetical protein J6J16_01350 [Lachnospiraceae bacterium]|nr:hypothetical protein [Lachnospiraceae bacterium]